MAAQICELCQGKVSKNTIVITSRKTQSYRKYVFMIHDPESGKLKIEILLNKLSSMDNNLWIFQKENIFVVDRFCCIEMKAGEYN